MDLPDHPLLIRSRLLDAEVRIVPDDSPSPGGTDYTHSEVSVLAEEGATPDCLKAVHLVKAIFDGEIILNRRPAMEMEAEIQRLRENILALLSRVGHAGKCSRCQKPLWWVKMKSGKLAPYTDEGVSHFADCPHASAFRKDPPPRAGSSPHLSVHGRDTPA